MTNPTQSPTPEAVKAALHIKDLQLKATEQQLASIIDRECNLPALKKVVEAARDAHDFINAIHEATKGAGRIDHNSIMRYGERLKTTAKKLDQALRAALDDLTPSA